MSYRIGSFNLRKFSTRSDKDIRTLAAIIAKEKFDIIALQEVFDGNAARFLCETIRFHNPTSKWDYRWDKPYDSDEGYAFLWNTATIELSYTQMMDGKKRYAEPAIYNQYHVEKGMPRLIRNPYYGRFKPKACSCEFRLINVHLRFSANKENRLSAIITRTNELRMLTNSVYHRISNKRYGNYLPQYTIMLGDFNLNLKSSGAGSPYIEDSIFIEDNGKSQELITTQQNLTTLKNPTKYQEQKAAEIVLEIPRDADYYSNNFDHFVFDSQRLSRIALKPRRIDTVKKYTDNDMQTHFSSVSDHVPISILLRLNDTELITEMNELQEESHEYPNISK